MTWILLILDALFFCGAVYFTFESIREKEYKAPKVGMGLSLFALFLAVIILWVPFLKFFVAIFFGLGIAALIVFAIPTPTDPKILLGAQGHIVSDPIRHDERDISFARVRGVPPGTPYYKKYYTMHPEWEEPDAIRREKGLLGEPGRVDKRYRPNVAMMEASFDIPNFLGLYVDATPSSESPPHQIDPARATEIVKNFALTLGADMVGVCKVNPNWVYSHRGEIFYDRWEDWGKEIDPDSLPPYAVVMLTEMRDDHVCSAPHTPSVAESARNYGRGAYLSTVLAWWFSHMGYRGIAQHSRRYDIALPPLAVDAGLGEVGRLGYLIAPKFGPRVRIFAVLTDMPLVPDKPVSIGVNEFCKWCKKCAESCPSKSILMEDKVVYNGASKWKLDAESCFDYWAKVGTDCSICMAICPYSRPNTPLHRMVRWYVTRSSRARRYFPLIDNFLYGRKWRPKPVPSWLAYPKGKDAVKEEYGLGNVNAFG
jgi:reductive dehalogenase